MQPCQSDVKVVPLRDSRLRLASAILGLVGLGLLLSLLPRTSFVSRPAGEIVDAVGPVWPEQSVEQVIEDGLGVVSEIRIWGAAGVGRGEAPVVAALLQGPDRELVRQERVGIKGSHLLEPYVLEFAPYHLAPGEALVLQLWVSPERRNHAIFGTMEPGADRAGPTLNLNPTEQGPLAYEVIWRGEGWRAALAGSWHDRLRLAGGIVAAVVAVLLRTRVARRLTQALGRLRAAVLATGGVIAGRRTAVGTWLGVTRPPTGPEPRRRAFYIYPWLIPAFAILHFLANNLVNLRAPEAIVPGAAIMAGVTVVFVVLRFVLKGAAPAAVLTGLLGIAFFSYGHIYGTPEDHPDGRYLLGIGIPVIVAWGMFLRGRSAFPHTIGRVLNLASVIILVAPLYQIGSAFFLTSVPQDGRTLEESIVTDERINEVKASLDPDEMPDIYYIILDGYPRSGSPASFDNSAFVGELEDRGFYVDPQARSNYACTFWSITSSMNMDYINMDYIDLEAQCGGSTEARYEVHKSAIDHALGRILTGLGYRYIHVSSGYPFSRTSRNADVIVDFSETGRIVLDGHRDFDPLTKYHEGHGRTFSLSNQFLYAFLETTLAKRILPEEFFLAGKRQIYGYNYPYRILDWFKFMMEDNGGGYPTFIFGHLVTPHAPYSFDRHGNIAMGGWSDDHDPSVDGAFEGQVLWLNDQLLELIDRILGQYDHKPIIVITSDHGYELARGSPIGHDILAAYLLPQNGEESLYQGITSVNVFRMILNYYFDLGLEKLEDKIFVIAD